MQVPYVDIAGQHAAIKDRILDAISRVIDHGQFILGSEVDLFERRFAELCGVQYAVGVNSGTDALILALLALGIGPGDEVITVPNTFVATVSAIQIVGATAVLVDVAEDYNMDPSAIQAAISPKTKALLPVHLTGRAARMEEICEIADRYGLAVIEDCAQAVLASHKGRRVGSWGEIGCFSMHPLKTLNALGDGGMLTTQDAKIYHELKVRRNLGLKNREDCLLWSHNTRLDTLQAAVLLVKLDFLQDWTLRRRENASYYRRRLATVRQICVPAEHDWEYAVYHTFVVQAERRDELRGFLAARGIGTAIHYPIPIHLTTAGRELGYSAGEFPMAEHQANCILSLPVYPELTTRDLDFVIHGIHDFYA